ncbi:hypothetical protein V8C42DRAFT_324530 [Trichoderma barbatum]
MLSPSRSGAMPKRGEFSLSGFCARTVDQGFASNRRALHHEALPRSTSLAPYLLTQMLLHPVPRVLCGQQVLQKGCSWAETERKANKWLLQRGWEWEKTPFGLAIPRIADEAGRGHTRHPFREAASSKSPVGLVSTAQRGLSCRHRKPIDTACSYSGLFTHDKPQDNSRTKEEGKKKKKSPANTSCRTAVPRIWLLVRMSAPIQTRDMSCR